MELVLLVLKINKAKVLAIFLILQIMHAYDKKHQKSSSPQKALPLLFSEDVYCSVNIHNFLCMYILLKMRLSSIICFVICFFFFFFSLSIFGTTCHCPQMRFFHILSESYLFSIELNSALLLHILIVFSFFAVINKASLNEYPCV